MVVCDDPGSVAVVQLKCRFLSSCIAAFTAAKCALFAMSAACELYMYTSRSPCLNTRRPVAQPRPGRECRFAPPSAPVTLQLVLRSLAWCGASASASHCICSHPATHLTPTTHCFVGSTWQNLLARRSVRRTRSAEHDDTCLRRQSVVESCVHSTNKAERRAPDLVVCAETDPLRDRAILLGLLRQLLLDPEGLLRGLHKHHTKISGKPSKIWRDKACSGPPG